MALSIGGKLNFGSVPSYDDYGSAYRNALSLNQQNYQNILSGYQSLLQNQMQQQGKIDMGYAGLTGAVLGDIGGIEQSQKQAIEDAYAQQSGSAAQSLIARGLGNTTVANSVQRGLALDKQKAHVALANQMAQLRAGYRSQLGLSGLNYANQANMQNTALGSQQLGWMNSVNSPYPNAMQYGQLDMMRGAVKAGAKPGLGSGFQMGSNVPLRWPSSSAHGSAYGSSGSMWPSVPGVTGQTPYGSPREEQNLNFPQQDEESGTEQMRLLEEPLWNGQGEQEATNIPENWMRPGRPYGQINNTPQSPSQSETTPINPQNGPWNEDAEYGGWDE